MIKKLLIHRSLSLLLISLVILLFFNIYYFIVFPEKEYVSGKFIIEFIGSENISKLKISEKLKDNTLNNIKKYDVLPRLVNKIDYPVLHKYPLKQIGLSWFAKKKDSLVFRKILFISNKDTCIINFNNNVPLVNMESSLFIKNNTIYNNKKGHYWISLNSKIGYDNLRINKKHHFLEINDNIILLFIILLFIIFFNKYIKGVILNFQNDEYKVLNFLFGILPFLLIISPPIYLITFLLLIVITIYYNRAYMKDIYKDYFIRLILIFAFLHLISLTYTENIQEGISLIIRRLPIFVFPFLCRANIKVNNIHLIKNVFVISMFLICIYTNVNSVCLDGFYEFFIKNVRFDYTNLMIRSVHPIYFSLILNIVVILILYDVYMNKYVFQNLFFLLFFSCNIFLVSSKIGIISFMLIMVIYMVYFLLKSKFRLLPYFLIFYLGVFIFSQNLNTNLLSNNSDFSMNRINYFIEHGDKVRIENWKSYCSLIKDNFLMGVGIGDNLDEVQEYRNKDGWNYKFKSNAHNQYLEEIAHFGFFGLILVMILSYILIKGIVNKNIVLVNLVLIIGSYMFTESILNREIGVFLFSFYLSIYYCKDIYQDKLV